MTVPARGSWELHKAIQARWTESGLDDTFRAESDNPSDTSIPVLHDTEARPNTPFPYCVYTIKAMSPDGHSSGRTLNTAQQYLRAMVTFTIYASQRGNESAKSIVYRMAKEMSGAFDPPFKLDMETDKHLATIRDVDAAQRLDDDEWAWSVSYIFIIDATYNAASC